MMMIRKWSLSPFPYLPWCIHTEFRLHSNLPFT